MILAFNNISFSCFDGTSSNDRFSLQVAETTKSSDDGVQQITVVLLATSAQLHYEGP